MSRLLPVALLSGRALPVAWVLVAAVLMALALLLAHQQALFDWSLPLKDIPARGLTLGLVVAGLAFLMVLPLARTTAQADDALQRHLLVFVLVVGFALRLTMLATEPALEDDQQRYLWEGALAAHGISPYRVAPGDGVRAGRDTPLGRIAADAGAVLDRVNHPEIKTIYPPVAIGAFALAHWISPFDLRAWRGVLLAAEFVTLMLLLALLAKTGQAPIWCALYWWNPIAIKEIMNSGHMDGLLPPFILGALLLASQRRSATAIAAIGLAAGIKVWPVLLAPLILRPLLGHWMRLLAVAGLLCVMLLAWALPIWHGGLDDRSGFTVYAERWQANGALLPALRDYIVTPVVDNLAGLVIASGTIARLLLACVAVLTALAVSFRGIATTSDLMQRAAIVTLVLVLVSPAQFPWYMLWTLPLLPFVPRVGVAAMAALLPMYYLSFYFSALGAYPIFRDRIVWMIWLPIWLILAAETVGPWLRRRSTHATET